MTPETRRPFDHDPDRLVDSALSTLRAAQPPAGMEERLLRTLTRAQTASATTSQPVRPPWLQSWFPSRIVNPAWGVPFALAVLALAVFLPVSPFARNGHPTATSRQAHTVAPRKPGATQSRPAEALVRLPELAVQDLHSAAPARAAGFGSRPLSRVMRAALLQRAATSKDPRFLPSYPAPPAQLTAQERIMQDLIDRQNSGARLVAPLILSQTLTTPADLSLAAPVPLTNPKDLNLVVPPTLAAEIAQSEAETARFFQTSTAPTER